MLHTLSPAKGSRRARRRVGRGNAAGGGTTAGKGTKGQRSRAGRSRKFGFEGGQTPLLRRQPKLGGFKQPAACRTEYEVLNLTDLEGLKAGAYDIDAFKALRLVRTKKPVKILAKGELTKKMDLTVNAASKSAREAVEKAGGSVTII